MPIIASNSTSSFASTLDSSFAPNHASYFSSGIALKIASFVAS